MMRMSDWFPVLFSYKTNISQIGSLFHAENVRLVPCLIHLFIGRLVPYILSYSFIIVRLVPYIYLLI